MPCLVYNCKCQRERVDKYYKGEISMNQLEVINEQVVLEKEFKVYGTFENPLFLAKDVAEWIEHSNPRMMLQKIDEDEKVVNNVYTLGGVQEAWFLTEDGLYEVLMQSRKPIAKQFKKEVKKILKEIRKTGEYSIKPQPKTERELASESMYDLIMGNLTTNESRTEALQIVVNHTKTIGKSEVCNDGTITIPGVKKFVIKHYGDILMQYNTFLSDQFVEFNRFLAYKQYLEGKRFRRKSGVGLEKKAIYQPTPLFHDNFVAQGFAQVRVIDDRGKMEITYTKDIEKYIVSESFKNEFLKYLGIILPQEVKQIA